jgi:hypothetical protein
VVSSSIPPPPGDKESRNLPGSRGAEWMVPPIADPSELGLDMVSIDHGIFGSRDAFFKESIRRDAIIGTRTVFALRNPSRCQHQWLEGRLEIKERDDLHRRQELSYLLNSHIR